MTESGQGTNAYANTFGVVWPDGNVSAADTWIDLETTIRIEQMDPFDAEGFRKEMQNRAKKWSGTEIDITGSSRDFLYELERAGMLRVIESHGQPIDTTPREPFPPINLSLYRGGGDLETLLQIQAKGTN